MINNLTWLKDNERFVEINAKLATGYPLSEEESTFCLSVAVLLIKEYEKDMRRASFLEFGYYLILSYALQSSNYEPLFDLSVNLGFYPISKFILDNELLDKEGLHHYFVGNELDRFAHQEITETLEQNKFRNQLVESRARDSCYIAPTSFGKSSMMVELISELNLDKIFIVVPTKSLLVQTYKLVKFYFPDRKIIFHDEMYDGENKFIAVFTQERALRLLKNEEGMKVDALLVDEAHNLFESSSRSILLARLIRRIRKRKSSSRVFYFSPLINDSENLRFEEQQVIDTKRIQFNIKEADISEYRLDGGIYKYNRFLNKFFKSGAERSMLNYIIDNKKMNNFLYLRAPRKVEDFAGILAEQLPCLKNEELEQLSKTIARNVHEYFYCVELIKKGVLYIHGKLPDLIKEYLEFKFSETAELKFIVANSVILEGVNLPVDNLYILNVHSLGAKELTNLIGRVNRLSEVFGGRDPSLTKLRPSVHFVNSEEFNRVRSNMSAKIEKLKPGRRADEVKNPTLLSFDILKFDHMIENSSSLAVVDSAKKDKANALAIIERESFLIEPPQTGADRMKLQFFESGLHSIYFDAERAFNIIMKRVESIRLYHDSERIDPIEKIYMVFISGIESYIVDASFSRLRNKKARNYYRLFVKHAHALTLKEHINSMVRYFYAKIDEADSKVFYIGSSYGELAIDGSTEGNRLYVDLSSKSHRELVNLALIKIKIESDFVSYKLNEFVSLLKDYEVVTEEDYNVFVYGAANKKNTDLSKLGLSGSLIKRLELDDQIQNIEVNSLGHVYANDRFKEYLKLQDDLVQFEIKKYITI